MFPLLLQRSSLRWGQNCRPISLPRLITTRSASRGRGSHRKDRRVGRTSQKEVKRVQKKLPSDKVVSTSETASSSTSQQTWMHWLVPVRYRYSGSSYTREQLVVMLQRVPLWLALVIFFNWDETTPYTLLTIHGPSMLPIMAPDGSEIWLRSTWTWWRKLGWQPPYQVGDLVGFSHPDFFQHVSCKRIVGVAGDTVPRYGQYVHLYVDQDPDNWGIMWPDEHDKVHSWINRECSWDQNYCLRDQKEESRRTLVVPPGHVWLEADCPALGIDSRHYGPIPVDWLKGKVVARLWPLWGLRSYKMRPHPIPLDKESLQEYNVHIIPKT